MTKHSNVIDDYIFEIEDYIGGNIEGVEKIDRMGLTVFLRKTLKDFEQSLATELVGMLKEAVGEDDEEPYDEGSTFWKKIRNRNELRQEIHTRLTAIIERELTKLKGEE